MVSALALCVQLSLAATDVPPVMLSSFAPAQRHLVEVGELAQYIPPPAGTPAPPAYTGPMTPEAQQLQQQIDALTFRIRGIKTEFPVGNIVLAALAFSAAFLLLPGLPMLILGMALAGLSGASIFLVIGVTLTVIGGLGLAFGIYAVVSGNNATQAARTERDELIRQRDGLQQQLNVLQPPATPYPQPYQSPQYPVPPGVQRELVSPPLVTVAIF